jgi:hypothetical protein
MQDEPSQQGFAADGLRIAEFFFSGLRAVYERFGQSFN